MPHSPAVATPTAPTIANILLRIFMLVSGTRSFLGSSRAPFPSATIKARLPCSKLTLSLQRTCEQPSVPADRSLSAGGKAEPFALLVHCSGPAHPRDEALGPRA